MKATMTTPTIRFETIEKFSTKSRKRKDGTVSIRIVKNLDFIPNPHFPEIGAYLVHLSIGSATQSRGYVTEEKAREAAIRFLLREAFGIAPTLH